MKGNYSMGAPTWCNGVKVQFEVQFQLRLVECHQAGAGGRRLGMASWRGRHLVEKPGPARSIMSLWLMGHLS